MFEAKGEYNFIKFKKASDDLKVKTTPPLTTTIDSGESIKEFYLSLIDEKSESSDEKIHYPKKTFTKESKQNESILKYNKHDFLKAAQNNDLNRVKSYLDQYPNIINECDEFKWNILMIAIASKSNQIIKYLFDTQMNHLQHLESLINSKDTSDNDALSLAFQFKNKLAIDLITRFKEKQDSNQILYLTEQTQVNKKDVVYCEACKKQIDHNEESYLDHIRSIVHQLNETETDSSTAKTNYYLRPSNKGYQLLVKSGWNEASGLGLKEQGEKRPIKTKLKLDRFGIGIEKKKDVKDDINKITTRNRRLFSIKNKVNGNAEPRIEDEFKRINFIKKTQKSLKKSKQMERNFRFYFNN